MTYHSHAFAKVPRIRPADHPLTIGVLAEAGNARSLIGIAYPYTHIGGFRPGDDVMADHPPPEVVWRLEIDRAWSDGKIVHLGRNATLEDRFVLRLGKFVELAEDAT